MSRFWTSFYIAIVFWGTLVVVAASAGAQQLSAWCPFYPYTLRGCAASPAYNQVYVGDSGFILLGSYDPAYYAPTWEHYGSLGSKSITLYAASFADDQDLAIAGSKGRIYYSTNDGTNWAVGTSGTTATIRSMATDENGYYFAVGDSGIILKSNDLGKTWSRLASPVSKQLNAIEFGSSGQYAVVVGNDSTIIVSTDDGATWNVEAMPYDLTPLGSALKSVDFSAVAISPTEDSVWVGLEKPVLPLLLIRGKADPAQRFSFFPNSGPLTSMIFTGDTSWYQQQGGGTGPCYLQGFATDDYIYSVSPSGQFVRNAIPTGVDADGKADTVAYRIRCVAPGPPPTWGTVQGPGFIACGDRLTIWRFTYPGAEVGPVLSPYRSYDADYLDADVQNGVGWIVGTQGIIDWTNDGGKTRYIQEIDTVTVNSVWQRDGIVAVATGWDGTILRTNDVGHHWKFIPSGTQERLHGIAFPTANDGIITGDYGTVLRSTDTGNSWEPVSNPATTYLYTVAFTNDHIGIAAGDSGTILRTTDTGLTWQPVNNILSGTSTSIRKVQAFPGGLFLAQAGSSLLRSIDSGLTWNTLTSPGAEIGMSFYNSQIGMIGSRVTSSELVPDTVYMSYTTDGGAHWNPFVVPMQTARRVVIYWLNSHQAVLNGMWGEVTEVTITTSGVALTQVAPASDLEVYPNPTTGDFRASYTTNASGPVSIQLFSEDGKDMGTLFSGMEQAGAHEQPLTAPPDLHGSFYLRITKDGTAETVPVRLR